MRLSSTFRKRGLMVSGPGRQKGAMTMFSAILILILLTEMLIYAVQVGVFEQRKSGNEMRHKEAFHAAETGIQAAHSYLLENTLGLTDLSDSGWLSDNFVASGGEGRWVPCADAGLTDPSGTHPCYGEPLDSGSPINLRDSSYFFSLDGVTPAELPIQPDVILPWEFDPKQCAANRQPVGNLAEQARAAGLAQRGRRL